MSFKSAIVIAIEKVENATISYNLSFAAVKPKYPIVHTKNVKSGIVQTKQCFLRVQMIGINCNRSCKSCPLWQCIEKFVNYNVMYKVNSNIIECNSACKGCQWQ